MNQRPAPAAEKKGFQGNLDKICQGDGAQTCKELGIRTIPVQLGIRPAALLACVVMAAPQVVVIGMLWANGRVWEAGIVAGLLLAQLGLMPMLVREPRKKAPFYNATGTTFYVLGMLASGFGVRALLAVS